MESHGLREGFVSQLWIKSCECPRPEVTDSANHPNSGNKDRCLSPPPPFLLQVYALAPFSAFVFFAESCAHCTQSFTDTEHLVSIMKSQCHSHALVLKPQLKLMHILKVSQSTVAHFLHVARLRYCDFSGSFRKVGSAVRGVCLRACITSLVPLPLLLLLFFSRGTACRFQGHYYLT